MTGDQAIVFGTPEDVDEHIVGDGAKRAVEAVIAATSMGELAEGRQGPAWSQQAHARLSVQPVVRHGSPWSP